MNIVVTPAAALIFAGVYLTVLAVVWGRSSSKATCRYLPPAPRSPVPDPDDTQPMTMP